MHNALDAPDFMERFEIPDLNTAHEIQQALRRQDDAMLWEVAKRAGCQQVFYEQLRAQTSTMSYKGQIRGLGNRTSEVLCSLVMVPVLVGRSDQELVDDRTALAPTILSIRNWLETWFDFPGRVAMYGCLFDYREVCMWTPSIVRTCMQRLIDSREVPELCATAHQFGLPEDTPHLAFFVAVIQRPHREPSLPPLDVGADRSLQAKIAGAIQICTQQHRHPDVEVLTPAFATDAIAAGLDRWLECIASQHPIHRWNVHQADQDVVLLQLQVGDEPAAATIPIRASQLGLPGIEDRLKRVAAITAGSFGLAQ